MRRPVIALAALLALAPMPALAQNPALPNYDIAQFCSRDWSGAPACVQQEKDVLVLLQRNWSNYSDIDRTTCMGSIKERSYTALAFCLDVRKIAEDCRGHKGQHIEGQLQKNIECID
jgi:hypothetical protein